LVLQKAARRSCKGELQIGIHIDTNCLQRCCKWASAVLQRLLAGAAKVFAGVASRSSELQMGICDATKPVRRSSKGLLPVLQPPSPELQRLAAGASKAWRRCYKPPSPELQRSAAGAASPPLTVAVVLEAADIGAAGVLQARRRARWRCCKLIDIGAASVLQVGRRDATGGATSADVAKPGGCGIFFLFCYFSTKLLLEGLQ
jgi:hypothetical protein